MSSAMIGGIAGAVFGLVAFIVLNAAAARLEQGAPNEQQRRAARIFRAVAWADVVLLTLVGYYVGPLVLG